jgi:ATP-dependent Clp protease ATP-binding subunit ClpC
MFERFTDRARRVVVQAQEESRRLNHNYIGTEHLLLGILREDDGVAAEALASLEVGLDPAREQLAEITGRGQQAPSGHIPFTPRAKKVLELSLREALQLGHPYIGPEHILLGLITEGNGVAVEVLRVLGAEPEQVRARVIELTPAAGAEPADLPQAARPAGPTVTPAQFQQLLNRLGAIDRRLAAIERQLGLGEPPAEAGPG